MYWENLARKALGNSLRFWWGCHIVIVNKPIMSFLLLACHYCQFATSIENSKSQLIQCIPCNKACKEETSKIAVAWNALKQEKSVWGKDITCASEYCTWGHTSCHQILGAYGTYASAGESMSPGSDSVPLWWQPERASWLIIARGYTVFSAKAFVTLWECWFYWRLWAWHLPVMIFSISFQFWETKRTWNNPDDWKMPPLGEKNGH